MFIIGITGPTGAGKTTALRVLEALGGQVIDCDAVYHRLLETDGELLGRIEAAFPGAVKDYALDRKALGARIYGDPEALERLTEITWPFVVREVERWLAEAETSRSCHSKPGPERSQRRSEGSVSPSTDTPPEQATGRQIAGATGFTVIDAIGLFESGLGEQCDLTVAVVADEETRVRRLMARDGISEAYARARIAAQKSAEWYAERADLVLENNGTETEFAELCRTAFAERLT